MSDDRKIERVDCDELWAEYDESVRSFQRSMQENEPGWFANSMEEQCYRQCLVCQVPRSPSETMPLLALPLRVNVIRNTHLGCSSDHLCRDSVEGEVIPVVNRFWSQARIRWVVTGVLERTIVEEAEGEVEESPSINSNGNLLYIRMPRGKALELSRSILSQLTRDHLSGTMQNKKVRRDIFLRRIIDRFQLSNIADFFDVWFFHAIGQQSQGCCIDRKTHTVVMGEYSTKGYETLTQRPLPCLAKTMAHELGHSLELGHPKGRFFSDGTSQDFSSSSAGRRNLMTGGKDLDGGGGDFLEDWQIVLARTQAENFISSRKRLNEEITE